jgi:hypothetical protein
MLLLQGDIKSQPGLLIVDNDLGWVYAIQDIAADIHGFPDNIFVSIDNSNFLIAHIHITGVIKTAFQGWRRLLPGHFSVRKRDR